ncbi:nitroreductase family protein [Limosilactobacillus reuteri]|uniref:nitroreductase family protein n=1 Tax=Limosilactobacillus reuteri TaxID=1598 RepID=UPI000A1D73CE|nr:nitroreductase family protein [Limosilactobacillus reuteri]PEG94225.1 nitroreductase [Lactobacillus sp. UMNPBX10]MBB1071753.1 nitroreductase family protein [Limosilactobacillus reuteri]MCC4482700.1 nitroreductase family protein [Limosilactobacillus reuteri]MCC4510787.1 nitroreductase family protein [Limosilactobacillus reuteri]MCC4512848.1 nitroreductase family protein [Limosilactobacillus reuteri]
MNSQFNSLAANRRSIYALGDNLSQTPEEIFDLVKQTIKNSPTAFNSQTVRVVVLFGKSSDKVWEIVEDALRKIAKSPDAFEQTKSKIDSFKAGYGTILYFTDTTIVHQLENDYPSYAANFANWAEQGLGGAQQAVWTALAEQGIGASLQHYNPLIDDAIHQVFNLPADWQLRAEMPFGSIEAPAGEKAQLDDEEMFKLIK